MSVDFPLPDSPTIAINFPFLTSKENEEIMVSSAYLKEIFSKLIFDLKSIIVFAFGFSVIFSSV